MTVSGSLKPCSFNALQRPAHSSGAASVSAVHLAEALTASNQGAKNAVVSTAPGGTGKPASLMRISE